MHIASTLYQNHDSLNPEHHREVDNDACDYVMHLAQQAIKKSKNVASRKKVYLKK